MKNIITSFFRKEKKVDEYYDFISSHDLDWSQYVERYNIEDKDPVNHYLVHWETCSLVIPDKFDSNYYLKKNLDVRNYSINPLVHYLLYGLKEGRFGFLDVDDDKIIDETIEREFKAVCIDGKNDFEVLTSFDFLDWSAYKEKYCSDEENHPAEHYLENWQNICPVFPGFFNTKLYLYLYPDIKINNVVPLLHFLRNGTKEGRVGWFRKEDYFEPGKKEYRAECKTIIVCSHDCTATGAPIVALEVARRLSNKYNVITTVLKKGELHETFVDAGFLHVNYSHQCGFAILREIQKEYSIHAVVLNSVESLDFLDGMARVDIFDIPVVSLIHEYAEYTRPVDKIIRAIHSSDIVIYPAESIKASGLAELKGSTGQKESPNHIWIQPQGCMKFNAGLGSKEGNQWSLRQQLNIPKDAIVIAGAGLVQVRKGVDWFLETCYQLLKKVESRSDDSADKLHFVWLGEGFCENDLGVSVWLEAFMQRTGIRSRCYFPGHVDSVSMAFRDVDVYLLTSRLDPFPNVAIDALEADCSIGCFESASGVADFVYENQARSVVAPYGDCFALADLIDENLDVLIHRDGVNAQLCQKKLSFESYVHVIEQAMQNASNRKNSVLEVIRNNTVFNETFDAGFYGQSFLNGDQKQHFLSLLQKGIVDHKPFPGSDVQVHIQKYRYDEKQSFMDYVTNIMANCDQVESPTVRIDCGPAKLFSGKIALQFHVYYNDLIPQYTDYFSRLAEHQIDLYVSHIAPLTETEEKLLRESVSGDLYLEQTPNSGRDIYPFHKAYREHIYDSYDLVGHFHTKKSVECVGGVGDRWRQYLLENLIGSKPAGRHTLSLFNNSEVGLVFAEDRHCVDEGENRTPIEMLLKQMGLKPKSNYFNYPLGTMFWARVEALKPLLKLDADVFELAEPIPYDGTVLHAFERIIPQIIMSSDYSVRRVYSKNTLW